MPSRKIPLMNGYFYHIYNRVIEEKQLFYSDRNYLFFLKLVQQLELTSACRLLAYCLIPTHYHLLVEITDSKSFPQIMSHLFDCYLKTISKALQLEGRFFQNRFKNKLVTDTSYLIRLCCYIHMNPVRAGLVHRLEEWPYSNYLEFVGKRKGKLWDETFFRSYFAECSEYEQLIKNTYSENGLEPFLFDD
jgi:putative transposase